MLGVNLGITTAGFRGGIADGAVNRAGLLLGAETQGLAIDFTDLSMVIRDTGTPANAFSGNPNTKLTYASPSTKWILNRSGIYESGTTLRTEYDTSGNPLGIRVEEARTNLCTRSNDITATWGGSGATAAKNATGVDGVANSFSTLTTASGATAHYEQFDLTWTAAIYTVSAVFKMGTHRYVQFTSWDGTASRHANFDLQAGAAGGASANVSSSMRSVGGGFYVCVMTSTTNYAAATGNITIAFSNSASDSANPIWTAVGTETIVAGFVQIEAGSFATSPIVTAGSTVTRAADNIYAATSSFCYSSTQFLVVAHGSTSQLSNNTMVALNLNGIYGAGDGALLRIGSSTVMTAGGNAVAVNGTISPALAAGAMIKAGAAFRDSDNKCAVTVRGGAVSTIATLDWTGTSTRLQIGTLQSGVQALNGHLKELVYLPRYDEAEIIARSA